MVQVRFFGTLRIQLKKKSLEIDDVDHVDDLLLKLNSSYSVDLKELKRTVIFINGKNIAHQKLYKTKLISGDIVDIFSPAGGG